MKGVLRCITLYLLVICTIAASGQSDIGIGTWRTHISFNEIKAIAFGSNAVYAASSNAVMIFDETERSFQILSKLNGLSGSGIADIAYDATANQLVIGYENGTLDLVRGNKITRIDPSRNGVISTSRRINGIATREGLAYVATDYGVLTIDLMNSSIRETWRDLGATGQTLRIFNAAFKQDSIFLATEQGVIAGKLTDNLLDFNRYKRFDFGAVNEVQHIVPFNESLIIGINTVGVFNYANGKWINLPVLEDKTYRSITSSSEAVLLVSEEKVYRINNALALTEVSNTSFMHAITANEDNKGTLWVGDEENGLVSNFSGSFERYLPNGPGSPNTFRLRYENGQMHLLHGGFSNAMLPQENPGLISSFLQGRWTTQPLPAADITDITFVTPTKSFVSSFGSGLIERENAEVIKLHDETNSPLVNSNSAGRNVFISAVRNATDGIWVANYNSPTPLLKLDLNGQWTPYPISLSQARFPVDLTTDWAGQVWMVISAQAGGGIVVFNPGDNSTRYLTEIDNQGELPSRNVNALAMDKDGYMWVGTDIGVAYFFSAASDAVKPIFEGRFLLQEDRITSIAVDGGNRKWFGTRRGVWLLNATGEESVYRFTAANSPLLSDNVLDIEIHPLTGEVFFATDRGVVSYRSDATESTSEFDKIKIFPNPVLKTFNGKVGITGLATDATVKITDTSGKLIWQTKANGGTASWHVADYKGRRVGSGVFLVFAVKQDGSDSMVGKIVVVD